MARRRSSHRDSNKGRPPAQVIGYAHDIDGERWAVRERRSSPSGVWIETGWPADQVPGPGCKSVGGPRIILTPALADALQAIAGFTEARQALAIGNSVLNRMRQRLDMRYKDQCDRWWQARLDDLRCLTVNEFAMKHSVHPESARDNHHRLIGPLLPGRKPEWERRQVLAGVTHFLERHATTGFMALHRARGEASEKENIDKAAYGYWKDTPQGRMYLFTSEGLLAAVPDFTLRRITRALSTSGWLVSGRRAYGRTCRIRGVALLLYHVMPQGVVFE